MGSLAARSLDKIQCLKRLQRKGKTDVEMGRAQRRQRSGIMLCWSSKGRGVRRVWVERPILSAGKSIRM